MVEIKEIPISEIQQTKDKKKKGGGAEGWRRERARQIVRENPNIKPSLKRLGGGPQGRADEAARRELRGLLRGEPAAPKK